MLWMVGFVLVALKLPENNVQAASLLLKKAYRCPDSPKSIPASLDTTVLKTFPNHTQLLEITFNVPFPMDTNTVGNIKMEYNPLGTTWITVANFDDKKGLCNFFNTVGREMWSDFEKSVGLTPKSCPIPKGTYHTNHYLVDLTKHKIPSIPPGKYRSKLEVREKANNRLILCEMYEIEDKA